MARLLTGWLAIAALSMPLMAFAADNVNLPKTITSTSHAPGSAGHSQTVAIGNLLQNEYGTSVRIMPSSNDVAFMNLVRSGRVELCTCPSAAYFAQEGVLMFSGPEWGPQQLRVLAMSVANVGMGMVAAGDVGITEPADLKGKRVASIRGGDSQNLGAEAVLAFGGLTWDDVERVEFPSYIKTLEGILNDQVDAAFVMTITSTTQQIASSSRGIKWPYMDPNDEEAWARAQDVAPYLQPKKVTLGAGISKEEPWHGSSYPYPIILGSDSLDYELASSMIRVLIEDYDLYKDSAPGTSGYALENQNLTWVMPFHQAVVDYYKERGAWTDEMQANQDHLLERETVLQQAWKDYVGSTDAEGDAFKSGWMKARATALESAGFKAVF
ncbi:TAXI family TRAP transporter solute-binding subunit [Alkalilimnicola sp. S0819]|uniref:TAXI family TRAP transporter solute-binding subunit n=1 Tax=Alkalilimnicola sp. S0819 TaxID=2613922 RepID=UPI001261F996|nr:TAXI family TRAP transporter solute-binding subunit [Alkalilimnicola sp. S0819]KAB7624086.1 TAXI family TRAP transporter solute-binding subunit [Alkalilimnicola sp. S0819]MPQ16336.1 TAXI family TRAP transporter solute-binding subunit [Alkalilimnicola sp. S0819]